MRIACILVAAALLVGEAYAQSVGVSSTDLGKGGATSHTHRPVISGSRISCVDGSAAGFPCRDVDLFSHLPIHAIGGSDGTELNDIWGWTDPETGREYAVVGRSDGTAFVDISDPAFPHYIGELPSHDSTKSIWRDIKVIKSHAVVVSDHPRGPGGRDFHGMQIFDLTRLRGAQDAPVTFEANLVYDGFKRAHNVVVNEETGFVYAVGSETCGGGLHMIDFADPLEPAFAGCFAHSGTGRRATGYTHDAQCVIYQGPDAQYQGREICFGSNETHVSIADVTDKANPFPLSIAAYPDVQYTHQAWLTPDHRFLLLDDELDEGQSPDVKRTRTLIFDVEDLDDPQLVTEYFGQATSIDHNQYVVGDRVYQANYTSGLRILDISDIRNPRESGFFDTYPQDDALGFLGAWSTYPFFASGVVVVSSINEGLFVLDPRAPADTPIEDGANSDGPDPEGQTSSLNLSVFPNPSIESTTIRIQVATPQRVRVTVHDIRGRTVTTLLDKFLEVPGVHDVGFDTRALASGVYLVRAHASDAAETETVTVRK